MTVSSTLNREQYATNGVTTAFTIHFPFFNDTDVNAIFVDAAGGATVLALNADFTVSGGGGAGGSLVATAAPPVGGALTIFREIPFTQEDDYVEDDPLPADTLEGGFDRAVMRDQQLKDGQDRALTFPVTVDPNVSGELPIPAADEFLRFSSDGLSIVSSPLASLGAVGQATETTAGIGRVATDAQMAAGTSDTVFATAKKAATSVAAAIGAIFSAAKSVTGLWAFRHTKYLGQTLTDAATIAWDVSLGNAAKVSVTANRTMGAPSNLQADAFYFLTVTASGGAFAVTAWNAVFKGGTAGFPTPTATSGKADTYTFYSPDGSNLWLVGKAQGF